MGNPFASYFFCFSFNDFRISSIFDSFPTVGYSFSKPTGIYICEVKNYKGFIYGNTSDQNLIQVKRDNYGNTFENPFYNPCKQVATHRYTLNGVLNDFGIDDIYINTCVFFTNPEASINIVNDNDCDCKIVTDGGYLVNHIRSGEEILQSWDVAAIVDDIKASYENQTKLAQ